jgi:ubiquinone/menaquinone biosynthesis C-methylase UbiE
MAAKPLTPYLNFDRVADDYDATRFLPETVREAVVDQLLTALAPGGWVLDAGVGTGRFALPLARRGVHVLGVDVSRNMMRQLLRKHPPSNLVAVQADLRRLPILSRSISVVLVAHVLHLVADWREVLLECRRVLQSNGVLFLLYEEGKRFPAREYYLARAREGGHLRPTLGAQTADEVVAFAEQAGGAITSVDHPSLHWQARRSHREVLQELEKRTYSQLWDISDEVHRDLMQQTLRYVRQEFGSEDETCATEAVVKLYAVRFAP